MSSLLLILLSAVLVSVIVIEHVPPWRPFVGIVSTYDNARGVAQTMLLALPLTTVLAYALSRLVLLPLGLGYLRTLATFAVVAAVASAVEPVMRNVARMMPGRPGFMLHVMANCALPGVTFVAEERARGLNDAIVVGIISAARVRGDAADFRRIVRATASCRCATRLSQCAARIRLGRHHRARLHGVHGARKRLATCCSRSCSWRDSQPLPDSCTRCARRLRRPLRRSLRRE